MVVQKTNELYKDSNSVECDTWLPLYKDKKTWKDYGLPFYIYNLNLKKTWLRNILLWLQKQTSDKYKKIFDDLILVFGILRGEK